jgi:YD repeat-containing protein
MSYKAFGAVSSISYGNNRTATLDYNSTLMRLTYLEVARPDESDRIMAYNYAYLENGLLGQVQDPADNNYTRYFEYNYRNQLTKTTNQWGQMVNSYSFDDWGNMTARDGGSLSYTTGSGYVPTTNRLTSTTYGGTTNFSYDAAGNMTAANSTTYQWDAANRLKSVNNGSLGSYGYDGNGKRVKKTESGTTRKRRKSERGTRNESPVTTEQTQDESPSLPVGRFWWLDLALQFQRIQALMRQRGGLGAFGEGDADLGLALGIGFFPPGQTGFRCFRISSRSCTTIDRDQGRVRAVWRRGGRLLLPGCADIPVSADDTAGASVRH